jgi:DNA polymerase III epsilon subunit-like protein
MKILVVDTETTNKPPGIKLMKETVEFWPHIVQMSFILFDDTTYKYTEYDYLIKTSVAIDNSDIHGITKGMNTAQGFAFTDIYEIYNLCVRQADIVVGHNLSFDLNMIQAECFRNQVLYEPPRITYCTMMSTTRLCNLPQQKWPRLEELHTCLFHEKAMNLHNALQDCIICLRCYLKIMNNVDLFEKIKKLRRF